MPVHHEVRMAPLIGRPIGRKLHITLVSLGWRSIGANKRNSFEDMVPEMQWLLLNCSYRSVPNVNVWLDCRVFKNPQKSDNIWNHVGTHVQTMRQCVAHESFDHILKQIKKAVADSEGQNRLTIACVCNSGTHRSVAISTLGRAVLQIHGYEAGVRHLSKATWQRKHRCSTCFKCSPNHPEKLALFHSAAAAYAWA